jgi:iron complex outermembrane recepter protein
VKIPIDSGTIANSATETSSASFGASAIGDKGFFGANVSLYDTTYGIPSEEDVLIDLAQRRLDLKGALRQPVGAFRGVKFRFGASNYEHSELEGEEVGTRFETNGYEGRVELLHKDLGPMRGAFGFQALGRDLTVTGEEAFLPPTDTHALAAFVLEEIGKGKVRLALGARAERQVVDADGGASRTMTGVSGSIGLTAKRNESLSFGVTLAHSERLPGAEELFSDGPHAATNAFEVGDPDLEKEKSLGLDASVKGSQGRFSGELSFFRNSFDGYIFERFTDETEDDLRVVRYEQREALFWGFEAQAALSLLERTDRHLSLEGSADFVRAKLVGSGDPLPRIAPMRLGLGLHYRDTRFDVRGEARRVQKQDRVAVFETPTDGYTFVNATLSYRIFGGTRTLTDIVLRATNAGDVEGRNHVSYLKDLVPLPGRDVRLSVRMQF